MPRKRLKCKSPLAATIQDSHKEATSGDVIKLQAVDMAGNLSLDWSITVTLKSGYNCDYSSSLWQTSVQGMVTITGG